MATTPRTARLRLGCSGWSYAHWRQPVYHGRPAGEWLPLYSELFDSVEVNATFYRLPSERMVSGWAEHSPPGFLFAVKMSRYATHIKRLDGAGQRCARLLDRLGPLIEAGKLGPLLWQLPETFHRDDERLVAALRELPAEHRHAIEFRHPSWFCEPVMRELRAADVALVIGDHPSRRFQTHELTADWTYVRFHHGSSGLRGNYSQRELRAWAGEIEGWVARGEVFAYFNNDWEAFAVRDAVELQVMLRPRVAAR